MSDIDLTKPLQWTPDGTQWIDAMWHRSMDNGDIVIEFADREWTFVYRDAISHRLRNKPERRVRPYTFEEARSLVGQCIRYGETTALVVAAWQCPVRGASVKAAELQTRSLTEALAEYTHPDGSPFGVIEHE